MKIGIIGAGNLGKAIIDCMQKNNIPIMATGRTPSTYRNTEITADNKKLAEESGIIILAVKPNTMEEVLKEIKTHTKDKLIITFAAGLKISFYEKRTASDARIVRAMTNLAIKNQKGMSAYILSGTCTEQDKNTTEKLLSYLGKHTEVEQEDMLDVITGVSGSAIAYFIKIMDIFRQSAAKHGIPKNQAKEIIMETVKGSLSLMENTGQNSNQLISSIASKGGTTEQGLKELKERDLENILSSTIEKTIEKCRQVGDNYD